MTEFERLGERIARGLGGVSEEQYESVRVSFMQRAVRASTRQPKRRWLVVGGALLALGAVGITSWIRGQATGAAASTMATAEDLWLEGPKHGAPTRVELGSGAHVDLVAGTRCRVHRTREGRTRVTLEGGVVEVMVSKSESQNWSFYAGPYLAKSEGGEFFLNYQPSVSTVEAGVTSGTLHVSGGPLGTDSVVLEAGQRLSAADGNLAVGSLHEDDQKTR